MEILRRAYLIFEAVYQYVVDLQFYLRELNEGFYIQQNLETIFNDAEGKQLLVRFCRFICFDFHPETLMFRLSRCICTE